MIDRDMELASSELPDWPIGMNREQALAYTGVSAGQMRRWQQSDQVRFLPVGPRGSLITSRRMLDEAVRQIFRYSDDWGDPIEFDS